MPVQVAFVGFAVTGHVQLLIPTELVVNWYFGQVRGVLFIEFPMDRSRGMPSRTEGQRLSRQLRGVVAGMVRIGK